MFKKLRNLIIFALFTAGGGWLGIGLNNLTGSTQPPMESLGALVWLTSPALAGLLLRALAGDGWQDAGFKPNLRAGWKWYITALLVYPLAALLMFGIATLFGVIDTSALAGQGLELYLSAAGALLAGSFIKNIFEEFAWRGYLTPRLEAAKLPAVLNHLIVGVLWWSWHLPYYAYYLDKSQLEKYTTLSLPVFLTFALLGLFPTAILFGELRLLSKSVWPVFILHEVINALSMPLILLGLVKPLGWAGVLLSPTNDGLFTSLLLGAAGLALLFYRLKTQKAQPQTRL
jgi:membrane protease YdiL (CAAX protease family)